MNTKSFLLLFPFWVQIPLIVVLKFDTRYQNLNRRHVVATSTGTFAKPAGTRNATVFRRLRYVAYFLHVNTSWEVLMKLTGLAAFITTAIRFYVLQLNFPSRTNLQKVRDDAFTEFWTKVTGRVVKPFAAQRAFVLTDLQNPLKARRRRKDHMRSSRRCCPAPTESFWI